jgi:hypothetical protein
MPTSTSGAPNSDEGTSAQEGTGALAREFPHDEITAGITVCHRNEGHDVYGGRARNGRNIRTTEAGTRGWLGNPHKLTDDRERAEVIAHFVPTFYGRLATDPDFREVLLTLPGKRVACWCRHSDADEPACHLDVVDHFLRGGRMFVREFLRNDLGVTLEQTGDGTHRVITGP